MVRLLAVLVIATSCGPIQRQADCSNLKPAAYPDQDFAKSTSAERALNDRFEALMAVIEGVSATPVTQASLEQFTLSGVPSLASASAPEFANLRSEVFAAIVANQGKVWVPSNPPSSGGRLGPDGTFTERGVETGEFIEKVLFGALSYSEAVRRIPTATTPESIDQLVALYGASPAFPQDDKATHGKDTFTAKYAKRRTPPGGTGSYSILRDAFVTARLAAASGCDAQRMAALEVVQSEWERVLSATAIYYFNNAASQLQDAAADDVKKNKALRSLSEGAGFLQGLKFVPAPKRKITDQQLDEILSLVKVPSFSTSMAFRLLTEVPPDLEGFSKANGKLQALYSFSADDMARFRTSY